MPTKISEFSIEVPAKWVISGEHSVLRGKRALAFPHSALSMTLSYQSGGKGLSITNNPFQSQILHLIGRALEWIQDHKLSSHASSSPIEGTLEIEGTIPIGAGLGSSAALCVAIARFVLWKEARDHQNIENWLALATHLEDVFHGKSSGMDVSVIAHSKPVLFSLGTSEVLSLDCAKLPKFEFYDSGLRGSTRDCIEKVKAWNLAHPTRVQTVDDQMGMATELALRSMILFEQDPQKGIEGIAAAMKQAQDCFETWGLVPAELIKQKTELLNQGAMAVKLTGAGLGGFWVALWPLNRG